jgi:hypothetical protein
MAPDTLIAVVMPRGEWKTGTCLFEIVARTSGRAHGFTVCEGFGGDYQRGADAHGSWSGSFSRRCRIGYFDAGEVLGVFQTIKQAQAFASARSDARCKGRTLKQGDAHEKAKVALNKRRDGMIAEAIKRIDDELGPDRERVTALRLAADAERAENHAAEVAEIEAAFAANGGEKF